MLLNKRERNIVNKTVRKRINKELVGNDLLEKPLDFEEIFGDGDSDLDSDHDHVRDHEMNEDGDGDGDGDGDEEEEEGEGEGNDDSMMNSHGEGRRGKDGSHHHHRSKPHSPSKQMQFTAEERAQMASMSISELSQFMAARENAPKKPQTPKKPRKKAMSLVKLRLLLRSLPESTLYAYGNKLNVIIPLTTTLISEGHKVIVFGRHLKMLCIVDECLQRRGIHPLHYNGSLNTQQREDALRAFTDESHNVILITVGAGGEGITITEADRIIIIDPNWNPTVDDQAIDRAWVIFTF